MQLGVAISYPATAPGVYNQPLEPDGSWSARCRALGARAGSEASGRCGTTPSRTAPVTSAGKGLAQAARRSRRNARAHRAGAAAPHRFAPCNALSQPSEERLRPKAAPAPRSLLPSAAMTATEGPRLPRHATPVTTVATAGRRDSEGWDPRSRAARALPGGLREAARGSAPPSPPFAAPPGPSPRPSPACLSTGCARGSHAAPLARSPGSCSHPTNRGAVHARPSAHDWLRRRDHAA